MQRSRSPKPSDELVVGVVQMAPVWLDREKTLDKVLGYVAQGADQKCRLIAFSEVIIPGYPFWIERTDGARFNSPVQKKIFAHYMANAVQIEAGHLAPLCTLAGQRKISVYVGCIERPPDRGGHSLYCTLVYVNEAGVVASVHRKLMPTYEERLAWSTGDGHGLRVHSVGAFTVGGLNCWENWMPLVRTSLYGQGEDLHVAAWPGAKELTQDITRFIALESRSYVLSASGLMRISDIPGDTPYREEIVANSQPMMTDGGSCIAGPDGNWVVEPVVDEERLLVATLDHERVRQERQNFDPSGHYGRPDVTQLTVNRSRQSTLRLVDDGAA